MDKQNIIAYLELRRLRCQLSRIYIPAEEIDISPGARTILKFPKSFSGTWVIVVYFSGYGKSHKRQKQTLTKQVMLTQEIFYFNDIIKINSQQGERLVKDQIPFFAIRNIIKERAAKARPEEIIYGESWK